MAICCLVVPSRREVLIDADDLPRACAYWPWNVRRVGRKTARERSYVTCKFLGETLLLHRVLVRPMAGTVIDHRNSDGLDNRRENLRVCSHTENMRNRRLNKNSRTGYKGVRRKGSRFLARITVDAQRHDLGYFDTAEAAHEAYKVAAVRLHGQFARFE